MVQTATAPTAAPEIPTTIFDTAISDAERLLELFDKLTKPGQQANEVLKRAALLMTLTAGETFVESYWRTPNSLRLATGKRSFEDALSQQKFNLRIHRQISQLTFAIGRKNSEHYKINSVLFFYDTPVSKDEKLKLINYKKH